MLNNELSTTTNLVNMLFKVSDELKVNPKDFLREVCKENQVNFSGKATIHLTSNRNFGKIRKGNELIFDIFQRELINNKIYYFIYEDKDITYEDFGRYNTKDNTFITEDDVSYTVNKNFHILGQLVQISGDL